LTGFTKDVIILAMKNKIICLAIGVIASLIIAELLLRIAAFGYNLVYRVPKNYKDSDYRILCVGESTTFGIGTSNPPLYCYPRQLEKRLNEKFPGLRIKCFYDQNIGLNTTQNLIKLPSAIRNYRPNLVIFMVGANNWWNLDKSNIVLFNKNVLLQQTSIKLLVLLNHFRVYKLLKWLIYSNSLIKLEYRVQWPDAWSGNEENTKIRMKMVAALQKSVEDKYNMDIFDEIAYYDLQEMIKICKRNKIEIFICSYPDGGPSGLYSIQKKASLLFNCYFVDNRLIFSNLSNTKDYFSSDGSHPNEKGYGIVAENIYNCILEHKLIK